MDWESKADFERLFLSFSQQGGKQAPGVAALAAGSAYTFSLGCLSMAEVWLD